MEYTSYVSGADWKLMGEKYMWSMGVTWPPIIRPIGKIILTSSSPMNLEDVSMILPMGLMIGGHVTPIDHMYFSPINFQSAPDTYDVYSIGKGVITQIGL